MKKKLLSFLLTLCLLMPCALALTACGGSGHTHEYETTWSKDATSHWYACKGEDCEEKKDKATHTYNVDTCSVCGYVNSDLTPATLQTMDTYFSGVKAEYLKDSYTNASGQTTTFEELLDNQIDVLAQDLLYRLAYVYGSNDEGVTNRETSFDGENKAVSSLYNLKLADGTTEYKYNDKNATISNKSIVMNYLGDLLKTDSFKTIDIDADTVLSEMAKSLLVLETESTPNYLQRKNALNFVGAISGYNMKIVEDLDSKYLDKNIERVWKITTDSNYTNSTLSGILSVKDSVKLAIAQILANDTITNDYETLLEKVDNLGYFTSHKSQIIDYIYNNVIGSEMISKDNEYAQYYIDNHEGAINATSIVAINNNTSITDDSKDFDATNNPRLYKGYSIVVPAIVEQALANTFDGTTASLYPKMSRTAYESTTTTTGFTTEKEYQTITLMPKADAITTKLVVKLTGVGDSIGQTIALDYDVVINGTVYSGTKNVTLTSTEQEVEIDLSAITSGATLGAYNGTTTSHTSGNAFDNNDFNAQGDHANSDGNNYIKLDFNNTNNYSFIVTFGGMYNK